MANWNADRRGYAEGQKGQITIGQGSHVKSVPEVDKSS